MATRVEAVAGDLYEQDFYVWIERQAELLRARRFADLDIENMIEEVEALGRSELNAVIGNASVVIEHLLKLQHSPSKEPRAGWRASVREHRRRLRRQLTPRLRQLLAAELPTLYEEIRSDTADLLRDHGEAPVAEALPASCPYDLDQITGPWLP